MAQAGPQIPLERSFDTSTGDPERAGIACPVCGDQVQNGGRYCENCGTDIENASAAPVAGRVRAGTESRSPRWDWQLVVACDRDYFGRVEADDIEFPDAPVERTFSLTEDRVSIGRNGAIQPGEQAVDLSAPPADAGVSRQHALLERQPDGGWTVVDCHSTNGTYLNDRADPISCEQPVPVADGDQIHLGAWTTITLRFVPRPSTVRPRQAESSGAGSRPR